MQELAFGVIGMTTAEFWNSSPIEFHYRQKGYFRKVEDLERREWERVRWQTTVIINSNPYMKETITEMELRKFPWEKDIQLPTEKQMDEKTMKRVIAAMDADAKA